MWGDYCILLSLHCCIAKYNLAVVARDHIRRDRSGASSVPRRGVWVLKGCRHRRDGPIITPLCTDTRPARPLQDFNMQSALCTAADVNSGVGFTGGSPPSRARTKHHQPTNPQQVQCITMESPHRPAPRFGSQFSLLFSILSSPRWRYSLPVLLQALMPAEPRYVRICMFTHYTHPDDRITNMMLPRSHAVVLSHEASAANLVTQNESKNGPGRQTDGFPTKPAQWIMDHGRQFFGVRSEQAGSHLASVSPSAIGFVHRSGAFRDIRCSIGSRIRKI